VINTLSWVDYATIVTFSTTAEAAGDGMLLQMTVENRALLKKCVHIFTSSHTETHTETMCQTETYGSFLLLHS
jgi:hypothetical protein